MVLRPAPTEGGQAVADQPASLREDLYRAIRLIRRFEERAIELVKSGDIVSGIHPCIGQEAVAAGVGAALRPDDAMMANHRGHGHMLAKGSDPGRLLAEMAGRTTGVAGARGGSFHPSDFSAGVYGATGSVGHGAAQATGVGWAFGQDGSGRVAISIFGDGAVNQGALLESLNLAALWHVPVIFVCENNLYATTLPAQDAIAGTVTGRAEAFGIPASSHDGMDAEVVWAAAAEAVDRARGGGGPSFLEFRTYRYEGHHTFELGAGLRYRDLGEVDLWRARDPMEIQGARLAPGRRQHIDQEAEAAIGAAVRFALDSPRPDPDDGLAYLYSTGLRLRAGWATS